MIKPIIHDTFFLSLKSSPATAEDLQTAADLRDTLAANADRCVGMAANMIGVSKRIIIYSENGKQNVMFNPVIREKKGEYTAREGCLSLEGERETVRFREIVVEYEDSSMKKKTKRASGFTAQIIQHEIDHINGILI